MTDPSTLPSARPPRPTRPTRLPARPLRRSARAAATPLLIAALFAACSTGAGPTATPGGSGTPPTPTTPPTAAPTATPVIDGIQHPTGATDVILRMESGGGFVPIDFLATNAPSFTLYGDGTVVFKNSAAAPPEPVGGVNRIVPFQIVRLNEEGIQALLAEALGPGALAVATGPYIGLGADIPTTTFTISADGGTKDVSVSGFLPDMHPKDAVIIAALGRLAERLDGFADVVINEQPYTPSAHRGVVMSVDQAFGPVIDWPWADIAPADFLSGENEFFLTRAMTPAEVAVLGIPGAEGGFMGLTLKRDGKLYSFALRPLLPDETK
jgi:hypothetical protein